MTEVVAVMNGKTRTRAKVAQTPKWLLFRVQLFFTIFSCLNQFCEAFGNQVKQDHQLSLGSAKISKHAVVGDTLPQHQQHQQRTRCSKSELFMVGKGNTSRENEIRRKIMKLKKQGRISKSDEKDGKTPISDYESKVRVKLGNKAKMLGYEGNSDDDYDDAVEEDLNDGGTAAGQIGSLKQMEQEEQEMSYYGKVLSEADESGSKINVLDPALYGNIESNDVDDEEDMDEQALMELVAEKLLEKNREAARLRDLSAKEEWDKKQAAAKALLENDSDNNDGSDPALKTLTSGVGGSFTKNSTATKETYKPKTGSWGVFERPKDISKAFGGGRRIGPGFSDEEARQAGLEDTRAKMKAYRESVGIDVESEKIHSVEIKEARELASLAMRRGRYTTAVSALEQVTSFCSSNSPVGGLVFLDLAMAYEAAGRPEEAVQIYNTLTKCKIDEIKSNAKRLLYNMDSLDFMRNAVKAEAFAKKKVTNEFIDATGMDKFAENFDDKYCTSYVDLDRDFYKKLSSNVVRSYREARLLMMKATDVGMVSRRQIVQALRFLSRQFDDSLDEEIKIQRNKKKTQVLLDGKPIVSSVDSSASSFGRSLNEFVLGDADQMIDNIDGEWRLQLLADKQGDGVKFFNSTLSWQIINTERMTFESMSSTGFLGGKLEQSGDVEFEKKRRIIKRRDVQKKSNILSEILFGSSKEGAIGAVTIPQQIISVDSVLLITKFAPAKKGKVVIEKDYFAVWRRVETGKYSSF